jgi:Ca2+-binding RTX toxin-like protein
MGLAVTTVYSGSEYTVSDEITGDFYGGNFLFTKDLVDGTFGGKVDYLNINLLRFPGGAMTEKYFDVNNPDNTPVGENRETLTNFLSFAGENDMTPVIVVPIKKYINDGISIEQAALEIFNFVQRVTSGEFGNVKIDTFEIGNEYNIRDLQVTGAEYGAYAAAFALAIKAASAYDVDVAVQAGTHWGQEIIAIHDNNEILQAFTDAGALHAVDTIVFHTYPRDFSEVNDRLLTGLPEIVIDDWNDAAGRDLEIFVSEWNVQSSWDIAQRDNYGLAQAATLIKMTSEMLKMGVDMGAIWAIQQNTKTELAGAEGDNDIRIAGEIFRMLSESTVGTQVLDIPNNIIGNGQVAVYAFESKTKTVVFLSALDIIDDTTSFSVDLNLSNTLSNFTYVWGEKLSTEGQFYWHNGEPTLSTLYPPLITIGDISTVSVTFDKDYEVIKLVFLKDVFDDTPVHIVGDNVDDSFITGGGDDLIRSAGGNDTIISKTGDDKIVSGDGNDTVISGRGNDTVWGGNGRDIIAGGEGDDTIGGGSGSDILDGGKGNDILYGGDGDDLMRGGENDDILYGGLGNDILGGGKGADILHGKEGDDLLKGGLGNDILYGGLGNDILRGSYGNDTIIGNEGDDILWGGDGQDTFVFSDTSGSDTIRNFEIGLDMLNIGNISFDNVIQTITSRGLELSFGNSNVLVSNYDVYLDDGSFILI